jgi:hypothetical protein
MESGIARNKVTSNPSPTTALELKPNPGNEDRSSHIVSTYYKAEEQ